MKIFLFLALISSVILSKELALDTLLKEYENSASLYKETKRDASGMLIVYSREDLDAMQAYSLKDVLKTIRMSNLSVSNIGTLQLKKSGQGKNATPAIKVYIDNYELTTVLQSNALDMYANMDIYFIDHIEIYQSGSSFAFGNMPGNMVIRLYSKNPSRENSSSFSMGLNNKSGYNLRAIDASTFGDDYNYLIYADTKKINYNEYNNKGYILSRDMLSSQAHFRIYKKDDFDIEIDAITTDTDIFSGLALSPIGGKNKKSYGYINLTKYFDTNIKLSLSTSIEKKNMLSIDDKGLHFYDGTVSKSFNADAISNTYKLILEKKIINGNSDFLIGTQFQRNTINIGSYNSGSLSPKFGANKLDIYMLYSEELFNINKNNLLALSAKIDHYRDSISQSHTDYSARIGYISHLTKNLKTKLFLNTLYSLPTMIQTSYAAAIFQVNPKLEDSRMKIASTEIEYTKDKNKFITGYTYKVSDNSIVFNKNKKTYINLKKTLYFNRYYLRDEYRLNLNNKFVFEYYSGYKDYKASPNRGLLLQIFTKIDNFNIYNELVYRNGYKYNYGFGDIKIDAGYDYTSSISYEYNKNIQIKLKGENLLNKAFESVIDPRGLLNVPSVERKVFMNMEYTF